VLQGGCVIERMPGSSQASTACFLFRNKQRRYVFQYVFVPPVQRLGGFLVHQTPLGELGSIRILFIPI